MFTKDFFPESLDQKRRCALYMAKYGIFLIPKGHYNKIKLLVSFFYEHNKNLSKDIYKAISMIYEKGNTLQSN